MTLEEQLAECTRLRNCENRMTASAITHMREAKKALKSAEDRIELLEKEVRRLTKEQA